MDQEHVGTDYITGWVVPEIRDIALVTSGISRWHNHYIEGLDWLWLAIGLAVDIASYGSSAFGNRSSATFSQYDGDVAP